MSTPAPKLIGGVSVEWIARVADTLRREGQAFRAGAGPVIEVQSINTGGWLPLTLEGRASGDCAFASDADRDAALAAIADRVRPSFFTAAEHARARGILNTMSDLAARR